MENDNSQKPDVQEDNVPENGSEEKKDNNNGGNKSERLMCHVRYGSMSFSGAFLIPSETVEGSGVMELEPGHKVIVKSSRGIEMGDVVTKLLKYDKKEHGKVEGEVIRRASWADLDYVRQINDEIQPKEMRICRQKIKEHNLPMKLADVEHLFGGDRIIFYFLADGRIDFRELVKDLAREYRTRIEMKQIGVRDEARLLADYEHCGRPLCCKSFMRTLDPVTMKMAKSQKTTLDPAKISGRCGRLMCCLRFEDRVYAELKRALPARGSIVTTEKASGEVVASNILKQTVTLQTENERLIEVKVTDIIKCERRKPTVKGDDDDNDEQENNNE